MVYVRLVDLVSQEIVFISDEVMSFLRKTSRIQLIGKAFKYILHEGVSTG